VADVEPFPERQNHLLAVRRRNSARSSGNKYCHPQIGGSNQREAVALLIPTISTRLSGANAGVYFDDSCMTL
jgi:hypothetical protein